MLVSIGLLGIALKTLPVGTAYGVWVGVGAAGTAIAGMVLFGESLSAWKFAILALLIAGIAGVKLTAE
jgi:quaternary ammonium compound-resistance protein SugE